MKKRQRKNSWSMKLKFDGVPIVDVKNINEKDLEDVFREAKKKSV